MYVFAIGQLSHHLFGRVDLRRGAETVVMTLAVVYAWGTNWLEPEQLAVRMLLVGFGFASLLMSVAIDDAFRPLGKHFVNVLGARCTPSIHPPAMRSTTRRPF